MKKLMTTTLAMMTLGALLQASPVYGPALSATNKDLNYDGPKDAQFLTSLKLSQNPNLLDLSENYSGLTNLEVLYYNYVFSTTLSALAYSANVIGVGRVSNVEDQHFTVTVEHAWIGCTNKESLLLRIEEGMLRSLDIMDMNMPTNNSQIVFSASFFEFRRVWPAPVKQYRRIPAHSVNKSFNKGGLSLGGVNRFWWHVDQDDGLLYTQFTNIIKAVRFDNNWTNYYHLCRNAAISPSDRVREDGFWDMRGLLIDTTHEQRQMIHDDPLVDPRHKAVLYQLRFRHTPDPVTELEMENYLAALATLKSEQSQPKETPRHKEASRHIDMPLLKFFFYVIPFCCIIILSVFLLRKV